MKILILNSGSSSIKFQLFNMNDESVLAKGRVTRINNEDSKFKYQNFKNYREKKVVDITGHGEGLKLVKDTLISETKGVINNTEEISAIGHRVVHGGEKYSSPVIINEEVENNIDRLSALAPLHNPHNLTGIKVCKDLIPDTPQVAVFDTGFHQTMPKKAYMYALPYEYYSKYGIRRYGFHGTSHKYVAERAAKKMDKSFKELNIITCHLGNGTSIAAIKEGESIDTSMGLTPLEGLVMGTRSGDLDPSIVPFLAEKEKISASEVENILNKKSGLLGVSGISNDFREINEAAKNGDKRARIALELFYYRIQKYIGAYTVVMGGTDAIVLTGGIGENESDARAGILSNLGFLNIKLDEKANQIEGKETTITTIDSSIKVFVIPTNEELVIARATKELI